VRCSRGACVASGPANSSKSWTLCCSAENRAPYSRSSGLYIIDDKGTLRQITVNDYPVGRSVDEVLRLVQAFQFTDKHGEVCPAGWKPGADTVR
jgi:alkyl hydroperoxide reductase subunit AhpC